MFRLCINHQGQITGNTRVVSEKYNTRKEACLKAYEYITQITSELKSCNKNYNYKDSGNSVNITTVDSENYSISIRETVDLNAVFTVILFTLIILLSTAFHISLAFSFSNLAGGLSILFFITHIPLCLLLHADIIDFDISDYMVLWGIIALILLYLREVPGMI